MRGFLCGYEVKDFIAFHQNDTLFGCHKQLDSDTTVADMESKVRKEKVNLCRGYVESLKKSCKVPRNLELALKVREVIVGDDTMSIFEFVTHHAIH